MREAVYPWRPIRAAHDARLAPAIIDAFERIGERHVRGRGFVKQDHQGADPGTAQEGIILAGLSDAMALACGAEMRAVRVELELNAPVPVGSFLDVEARAEGDRGDQLLASATASVEGNRVASARGAYRRSSPSAHSN